VKLVAQGAALDHLRDPGVRIALDGDQMGQDLLGIPGIGRRVVVGLGFRDPGEQRS